VISQVTPFSTHERPRFFTRDRHADVADEEDAAVERRIDMSLVKRRRRRGAAREEHVFVVCFLVAFSGLLAGVLVLNWIVDPFALAGNRVVPPAVETDRSIKLTLLEELERSPETLILGSSRARLAEPSVLERWTGRSGFNAAVTAGTAADAWVSTRYAADLFPQRRRRYVWFVDVAVATNGVNPQLEADPRARRYLANGSSFGLNDLQTYLGTQATRASLRVLKKCLTSSCRARSRYRPDGSLVPSSQRSLPERAASLKRDVDRLVASIRAHPPRPRDVDPRRYVYFERTIAFMNSQGSTPVVVLNPIHPRVLAALRRYGFPGRARALAYFAALQRRLDFVVVDCQDITTWQGSASDFNNATHVNRRNMRRLLRFVARRASAALR
jgi:hypothetical protein